MGWDGESLRFPDIQTIDKSLIYISSEREREQLGFSLACHRDGHPPTYAGPCMKAHLLGLCLTAVVSHNHHHCLTPETSPSLFTGDWLCKKKGPLNARHPRCSCSAEPQGVIALICFSRVCSTACETSQPGPKCCCSLGIPQYNANMLKN
jgi:hypothetical protein